ncbi:tRNA (adenine-N1)-methyltransferase [Actinomycetaceae bacterium MB13-C1-2]|nr:tRNA (adenine-N1)-methyltransferase [Actinomycetaceae bacterium MB13-C1-2]
MELNPTSRDSESSSSNVALLGQAGRRGALREGDRVQITDPKGKMHTVILVDGGQFQSSRGILHHDDVIGKPDGQVVDAGDGRTFQVIRPLLSDYVLSMPRGAAIIYPKDAAQIVQVGDIFPGARVLESGVGSGALSLSLLSAVGERGELTSVELREDFADIAAANVDLWFGRRHPAWDLRVEELGEAMSQMEDSSFDRVVLDLLDPWTFIDQVARVLEPGGVFVSYITTVPQMSRVVEALRECGSFSEPQAMDSTNRTWHVQGLAVRPDHRMIGHTGYLVSARRMAPGSRTHELARHPAPAAEGSTGGWERDQEWSDGSLGLRSTSDKKVRRVRRDLQARTATWLDSSESEDGGEGK